MAQASAQAPPVTPPTSPATQPISLPPFTAPTEKQPDPPPLPLPPEQRLGIAVVGLGNLALSEVIPAIGQTKYCKLAALVSGTPDKADEVAAQHGIPARSVYSYENYDTIRDNPDVDIIYIILPNALHAEYTVRGAQAGKHILCEKPMATSSRRVPADDRRLPQGRQKADDRLPHPVRAEQPPDAPDGPVAAVRPGQADRGGQRSGAGRPEPVASEKGAGGRRLAARCRPVLPEHDPVPDGRRADRNHRHHLQHARRPALPGGRRDRAVADALSQRHPVQ